MKAETLSPACGSRRYGAICRALAAAAFATVVAWVSSGSAWAQDNSHAPKPKQSKVAKQQTAKREQMVFTGSLIRRDVPRHGRIAVTDSPLVIIDRKQIEQSGASTLAEVLKRSGTYR